MQFLREYQGKQVNFWEKKGRKIGRKSEKSEKPIKYRFLGKTGFKTIKNRSIFGAENRKKKSNFEPFWAF